MPSDINKNYWVISDEDVHIFRVMLGNMCMYNDPYLPQKYRLMYENSVKTQALLAWNISQYYGDNDEAIIAICDKYGHGRIIYQAIISNRSEFGFFCNSFDGMLKTLTHLLLQLTDNQLKEFVQEGMWNICEQISF